MIWIILSLIGFVGATVNITLGYINREWLQNDRRYNVWLALNIIFGLMIGMIGMLK
jgi:hypothetical protein